MTKLPTREEAERELAPYVQDEMRGVGRNVFGHKYADLLRHYLLALAVVEAVAAATVDERIVKALEEFNGE